MRDRYLTIFLIVMLGLLCTSIVFTQEIGESTRNRGSHVYFPSSLGYHFRFNEPVPRLEVDEDKLTLDNFDIAFAMGWRTSISSTHSMGIEGAMRLRSDREIYECIDENPCDVGLLRDGMLERGVDSQLVADVSLWYANRFFVDPIELQVLFGFSFVNLGDQGVYVSIEQSGTDDDGEPEYEYRSFNATNITMDIGGRAGIKLGDATLFFVEALYALPFGVNAGSECTLNSEFLYHEYPDYERYNCSNYELSSEDYDYWRNSMRVGVGIEFTYYSGPTARELEPLLPRETSGGGGNSDAL